MRFKKIIKEEGMSLTGKTISSSKFGKGYGLKIGNSTIDLCAVAVEKLGIDLAIGESVQIESIEFTIKQGE